MALALPFIFNANQTNSMAELSTEDIQFIKELRKAKEEGHISRRDALKGAGVLGVGSLLGGLGANEVVGNARADASTDDDDGDIGTPDNRQDVFADGVDSNLIQTEELNNGGPISDGDGTERQIWIIANGASDPSGADSEDIIFEEEE